MGVMKNDYFKIVCECIGLDKEILVDVNCKTLQEVHEIVDKYPEYMTLDKTWILYPMSITV